MCLFIYWAVIIFQKWTENNYLFVSEMYQTFFCQVHMVLLFKKVCVKEFLYLLDMSLNNRIARMTPGWKKRRNWIGNWQGESNPRFSPLVNSPSRRLELKILGLASHSPALGYYCGKWKNINERRSIIDTIDSNSILFYRKLKMFLNMINVIFM